MALPRTAQKMIQLWQQGVIRAHRFDQRTGGWLGMLLDAAGQVSKPNAVNTAAAIAYFAVFSIFPLILLSIAIASFGSLVDPTLIIQRLEFIAPGMNQLLGQNIDAIVKARGTVTIVAFVGLIWSASSVFYMLTGDLKEIWGIKRNRPAWKRQGLALVAVLALVGPFVFLASFASSMMTNLTTWLPAPIIPVVGVTSWALGILLDVVLFMVLYLALPHASPSWREILPGAIGAGLLWEIAKKAFLIFVSTFISTSNLIYGSVAAVIALLTWAYLSGLILLFGAYFSVAYCQQRKQQQQQKAESQT
jgi:membrane protein